MAVGAPIQNLLESILNDSKIAARNLVRSRRRSGLAVAATAFGVAALIISGGFIQWMQWAMREGTIQTSLGHLQVAKQGYFDNGLADPFRYVVPTDTPSLRSLAAIPHVKAIAPRLSFSGLASHRDATLSFIGEGVDPANEAKFRNSVVIRRGNSLQIDDPSSVIVGQGLAANLGVAVGDKIVLLVNTRSGGINAAELSVRGIFSTVSKAYDDSALRIPLKTAEKLLRVNGAHRWVILLDSTEQTDSTLAIVRQRIAGSGLEAVPWYALADFYKKSSALLSQQMSVMRAIVAAIVVVSILNTLTMNVLERTAEIGTLMALGGRQRQVLRRFLIEGIVIGLAGCGLGVAIGITVAWILSAVGIPMPPPPGMSDGYTARVLVTPSLITNAVLLASVIAAFASLYPAFKASRLEIVDALRHNR